MFANLKKKIEAEVGDLSRLTPSLRSVTQSEKMTPLSSRHGSVSSLASETSNTNKLTSPLSPMDSQQMFGASSGRNESGAAASNAGGGRSDSNQRLKRLYEEKIQNQELDFAWRLNSKDDEITKLQKQVDHLNNMLHSKEFETQQKLVRVQEDMDSLEGFSQQENAKIKHLLLNREEELSQLRATVMIRDSAISEFETQMKNITVENERLKKSLDEIVSRRPDDQEERIKKLQIKLDGFSGIEKEKDALLLKLSAAEERIQSLQKLENLTTSLSKERNTLEASLESKTAQIETLEKEMKVLRSYQDEKESALGTMKNENSEALENQRKLNMELQSKLENLTTSLSTEKNTLEASLKSKMSQIETLEKEINAVQNEKESALEAMKSENYKALEDQRKLNMELQSKLENLTTSLSTEKNTLEAFLKSKMSQIETLEKEIKAVQNEKESALEVMKSENYKALEDQRKLSAELQSKLDELAQAETENKDMDKLEKYSQQEYAKIERLLQNREEELSQLRATVMNRDSTISELEAQVKSVAIENERLKDSTAEIASRQLDEHEERVKNLQAKLDGFTGIKKEKDELVLKLSAAEERIHKLQKLEDATALLSNERNTLEASLELKVSQIEKLEKEIKVLQNEKESTLEAVRNENSEALEDQRKLNVELQSKLDELASSEGLSLQENAKIKHLLLSREEELSQLRATVVIRNSAISELEAQLKSITVENERQKKSLDEIVSRQLGEYKEQVKNLQIKLDEFSGIQKEKDELVLRLSAAEERIQSLQEIEDATASLNTERNTLEASLNLKVSQIETLEKEIKALQSEKESALEAVRNENSEALEDQRKLNVELQSKLDELAHVEVENGELILQTSEIQSKCDELEEENNFLKASANSDDYEALKRKVVELEADLLDRNQMLKQQSHQLQDLRRSLAKEINKNQAISDVASASASTLETVPQCNGSASQQQQVTALNSPASVSEPPTLPPQETDVNFMYLRSVIFKFLTTTDVQVTQQLTRVVATLLHLSEEETHLLSQATESRNGWISNLIIKS